MQIGIVTASKLNVRSGPSTGAAVKAQLYRNERVYVHRQSGEWYHISRGSMEGWAHSSYVRFEMAPAGNAFLRQIPYLQLLPLQPGEHARIALEPAMDATAETLGSLWNRYGALIVGISELLAIPVAASLAVLAAESSGRFFAVDGRMTIRFENHVFFAEWGKRNLSKYQTHFSFDTSKRWIRHLFRESASRNWRSFHGAQHEEWTVFEFASRLDRTAALRSVSMGGPQIMGFNHKVIGYETADAMYDSFRCSDRQQILGLFDFIQNGGKGSPMVGALRCDKYLAFAQLYNGDGQAEAYAQRIRSYVQVAQRRLPVLLRKPAA
jgi:hypothetical protein